MPMEMRKRFMPAAARAAAERMLRHNPRLAEMQELRRELEQHRKFISGSETGRLYNNVIEMVLKGMEEGQLRSKADIVKMLETINKDLESKGHNVNLKFEKVFPEHLGRSVEGHLSGFYHSRRGPLR